MDTAQGTRGFRRTICIKCALAFRKVLPKDLIRTRVCPGCGVTFDLGHGEGKPRTYCTACRPTVDRSHRKQWAREYQRRLHARIKCPVTSFICKQCGQSFEAKETKKGRQFCSPLCCTQHHIAAISKIARAKWVTGQCVCGQSFHGVPSRQFCSRACRKRVEWAKRNAMRRGVEQLGDVDPDIVLHRDGYRCQICGTYGPKAPEVDHIVPITKGGAHTYLNTQCLCRKCNSRKGNKAGGQLRLL